MNMFSFHMKNYLEVLFKKICEYKKDSLLFHMISLVFKLFQVHFGIFIKFEKFQVAYFLFCWNFAFVKNIHEENFMCILDQFHIVLSFSFEKYTIHLRGGQNWPNNSHTYKKWIVKFNQFIFDPNFAYLRKNK
jgi:hypothetical protein